MGTRVGGDTQSGEGSTGSTAERGGEEPVPSPVRTSRKRLRAVDLNDLALALVVTAVAAVIIVVTLLGVTGVWGGTGESPSCAVVEEQTGIPAGQCVETDDGGYVGPEQVFK